MNNSKKNSCDILHLPNEILLKIINELSVFDVFCSIINVNQRFTRLAIDSGYVRDLRFTTTMNIHTFYNQTSSIDTNVLSTICESILPQIHYQVHQLTVDQSSMKPILDAAEYPQLYSLLITDFQEEVLHEYLTSIVFQFILIYQKIYIVTYYLKVI